MSSASNTTSSRTSATSSTSISSSSNAVTSTSSNTTPAHPPNNRSIAPRPRQTSRPEITKRLYDNLPINCNWKDRDENQFMQADWLVPASFRGITLKASTNSTKADPPPNVYAHSRSYKDNLKTIREWYKGSNTQNKNLLEDYVRLSPIQKNKLLLNIQAMIVQQVQTFNERSGFSLDVPTIYCDAQERAILAHSTSAAASSTTTTTRARSVSISPVPLPSNINNNTTNIPSIPGFDNGVRVSDEYTGLLSIDQDGNAVEPATKKQKIKKHCADAPTMNRFFTVLNNCAKFMDGCVSKPCGTDELNDIVLIHVQTVEWTTTKGGNSTQKLIDGNGTGVTIFGRSETMIQRTINLAIRAHLGRDTIGGDPIAYRTIFNDSLADAMKEYQTSLAESRKNDA